MNNNTPLKAYNNLVEEFKENSHRHGYDMDTIIIDLPVHPLSQCKDCYICKDNEYNDPTIKCDYCQCSYEQHIMYNIDRNCVIIDHEVTTYGKWDSSDLFKVKWKYNNEELFGLIHFAVYYDPNAWDQTSHYNNDWYSQQKCALPPFCWCP
jgi:hypothetical protein